MATKNVPERHTETHEEATNHQTPPILGKSLGENWENAATELLENKSHISKGVKNTDKRPVRKIVPRLPSQLLRGSAAHALCKIRRVEVFIVKSHEPK